MASSPAIRVPHTRQPAEHAWVKLAEPLRHGQGIRVGFLGVTGKGKTTAVADFLDYLRREHLLRVVIIHDIKMPLPQYSGDAIAHEADALISRPPASYPHTLILRRRDIDHTPSVEQAARVTKHASYNGVATALVVDEFGRALTPAGREFIAPTVGELLSEGRAIGASLLWTTQLPQRVPPSAYDQSKIVLMGCGAKACTYLETANVVDDRTSALVAGLQVGQFIVAATDEDFDGVVYQVPPP